MVTPEYNDKQVIQRVYDKIKNCLRVCVVNTLADPIPVTVVTGSGSTIATIFNVVCTLAGTEYSQALPTDCKGFIIKARKGSKVDFAYAPAATEFLTLNSGFSFEDRNFYSAKTVYFKCSVADERIEIVAYK